MQEHQITHWLDAISIGTVVATLAGWLPVMAALVSMIWTCIRIVETRTVQNWMKKTRRK